jgi:hypothetical protein
MNLAKNISLISLTLGVAAMSSCLKDSTPNLSPKAGGNNVVAFLDNSVPMNYSGTGGPVYDNSSTWTAADTTNFSMNVAWEGAQENVASDITVNLAIDTAYLDAYNTLNNTSYVLPPSDVFSIPSSVVIKAGTMKTLTSITISYKPDWNGFASYAIPVTITSTSTGTVSTNYGSAIYTFEVDNAFAGTYAINAYHFSVAATTTDSSNNYWLTTLTPTANAFPFGSVDYNTSGYMFSAVSPGTTTTPASGGLTGYTAIGAPAAPASGFMTADNPGHFTLLPGTYGEKPGDATWNSTSFNNTLDASGGAGSLNYWIHVGYATGATSQNGYTTQIYENLSE